MPFYLSCMQQRKRCMNIVFLILFFFHHHSFTQIPVIKPDESLDVLEFPKGYLLGTNNYSNCAKSIDQLRAYPAPRFMPGVEMLRNMNWVKSMWMADIINHNVLQPNNQYKIKDAIAIQNELAENWNYYYNFNENIGGGYAKLNDKSSMVNAAFIDDINTSGKDYPLACITYRRGLDITTVKTKDRDYTQCQNFLAAKGVQRCLIVSQKLENDNPEPPCTYPSGSVYPRDENGNIISPGKSSPNSWSPLENNRKIYLGDAMALETAFDKFLNSGQFHLSSAAKQRIAMISEDNEVAVHYGPKPDGRCRLEDDKIIFKAAQAAPYKGDFELYQSVAKKNIDNDYRDYILNSKILNLPSSVNFLNYGVNGFGAGHLYQQTRETQKLINGNVYSTPDLYVNRPQLWGDMNVGANHGWQWFAVARYKEIYDDSHGHAFNDKWCAPYVSAGYNTNAELSMRPGQYLGFLKAVVLQGAGFFHPFMENNIKQGNAFCWQVAIPIYAQAIGSRLYHFLEYGKSMFGDMPVKGKKLGKSMPSFRFNSGDENHLIVVRQDEDEVKHVPVNRYAIVGSIMKNSNSINDSPLSANATFTLNKQQLTMPIRRQGSTYIYDYTEKNNVVFYQLDKWHQYEHPDYWTRNIEFEAEVFDNARSSDDWKIKSEGVVVSGTRVDLSNVTSYIHFNKIPASPLVYIVQPRNDGAKNDYSLFIRVRSSATGNITFTLKGGKGKEITNQLNNVNSKSWAWYEVTPGRTTFSDLSDNDVHYELQLLPGNTSIEIDAIRLEVSKF